MKNRIFWLAAGLGLMFDRGTKLWIMQSMTLTQSIPLVDQVFHLTYVVNPGAAFSLFVGAQWLRWLSLVVSLGLVLWAVYGPRQTRWEQAGYGCILSGALGNGIDRFWLGHVVDFLDFKLINFPVFNLADMLINIGIACLLIAAIRQPAAPSKT